MFTLRRAIIVIFIAVFSGVTYEDGPCSGSSKHYTMYFGALNISDNFLSYFIYDKLLPERSCYFLGEKNRHLYSSGSILGCLRSRKSEDSWSEPDSYFVGERSLVFSFTAASI